MIVVPATSFTMGSRPEDPSYEPSQRAHHVELSPFAIGRFEITNEDISPFLTEENNPEFNRVPAVHLDVAGSGIVRRGNVYVPADGMARRPVVGVTWQGARAYARWLSARTGQAYDLPTAAQWEAAARAGTTGAWWWGDVDQPSRYHGYNRDALVRAPIDVGSLGPNPWNIHDTSGNVWEWVLDCYDPEFHRLSPRRDPVLFDDECVGPEIRGGSFNDPGGFTRPGYRSNVVWAAKFESLGFRVARRVTAEDVTRFAVNDHAGARKEAP